jgi:exopolyphosphatase/guanosine-5'-triphosphate,3'-diphosphate pyrophosphatase
MTDNLDKTIAIMDMGTNSVRLMIVRIKEDQTYTILSRQKEMIRLGAGEFDDGYLVEDSMDRAVQVCRNFVDMTASFKVNDIIAVATSATRDANNQKEFLARLKKEAGLDIRVISGPEEARLIYLGVSSGTHVTEPSLFIDIGGGSTEIIVGNGSGYQYLDSLKLGAIRLTMLLLGDHNGPVTTTSYLLLQDYVRNKSIRSYQRLRQMGLTKAYGSSGTVQNLAEISCQTLHDGDPDKRSIMTLRDLKKVMHLLCSLPLKERQRIPGIKASRADIIIGGGAILDTVLTDLNIQEIQISNRELRDGILLDYLFHLNRPLTDELSVRQHSVLTLGRRCGFDEDHARTVAKLSLELFDSARELGLHGQDHRDRELFYYAAQLHDIGSFLSYSNHHAT